MALKKKGAKMQYVLGVSTARGEHELGKYPTLASAFHAAFSDYRKNGKSGLTFFYHVIGENGVHLYRSNNGALVKILSPDGRPDDLGLGRMKRRESGVEVRYPF